MENSRFEFQHFIPQFILKEFQDRSLIAHRAHNGKVYKDKKPKIWILNKHTGEIKTEYIDKTAGERNLYSIEYYKFRNNSLERQFSVWESQAAKVYKILLKNKRWSDSDKDREILLKFLCLFMTRSPRTVSYFKSNKTKRLLQQELPAYNGAFIDRHVETGAFFMGSIYHFYQYYCYDILSEFNFCLCLPIKNSFILTDTPVRIKRNRSLIENPDKIWENIEYILIPIASELCVLFSNKKSEIYKQTERFSVREVSKEWVEDKNILTASSPWSYLYAGDKNNLIDIYKKATRIRLSTLSLFL